MSVAKPFAITVDKRSCGTIEVDGADLTNTVRGFRLDSRVGDIPQLTLDVVLRHGGSVAGEATVVVDESTAALLESLGWTPPAGAS